MAFGIVFTHDTYTFYKDQFSHEVSLLYFVIVTVIVKTYLLTNIFMKDI